MCVYGRPYHRLYHRPYHRPYHLMIRSLHSRHFSIRSLAHLFVCSCVCLFARWFARWSVRSSVRLALPSSSRPPFRHYNSVPFRSAFVSCPWFLLLPAVPSPCSPWSSIPLEFLGFTVGGAVRALLVRSSLRLVRPVPQGRRGSLGTQCFRFRVFHPVVRFSAEGSLLAISGHQFPPTV